MMHLACNLQSYPPFLHLTSLSKNKETPDLKLPDPTHNLPPCTLPDISWTGFKITPNLRSNLLRRVLTKQFCSEVRWNVSTCMQTMKLFKFKSSYTEWYLHCIQTVIFQLSTVLEKCQKIQIKPRPFLS